MDSANSCARQLLISFVLYFGLFEITEFLFVSLSSITSNYFFNTSPSIDSCESVILLL